MALRRTIKKIVYAVGMVAGLIVFLFLVSLPFLGPGEEVGTVETPSPYQDIEVERVAIIPHTNAAASQRTVDLVAELRNPNPRAGVEEYTITFAINGVGDQEIATASATTYLLPGALQYAVALEVPVPSGQQLAGLNVTQPSQVQFIDLPPEIELPQFNSFLQDRQESIIAGEVTEVQNGSVRNTSTFDWERVEVTAVALDNGGDIIAVGSTFVGRLTVGEQRAFRVQWPKPTTSIRNVVAVPTTNVFKEENIIRALGDPGSLR